MKEACSREFWKEIFTIYHEQILQKHCNVTVTCTSMLMNYYGRNSNEIFSVSISTIQKMRDVVFRNGGKFIIMKVYLNEISGIADAITAIHMSKRSWTRDMEERIQRICKKVLDEHGALKPKDELAELAEEATQFEDWMNRLIKWGWKHITLLRYVDISVTVEGMHRGGQDDWDAHAKRFSNRILRSSTRLAQFGNEMSDWYKDKIISTDMALSKLGVDIPEQIEIDNVSYVKAINGYIRDDLANEQDVKRGLYMLSIPSNFIFKVDITEWSHVYKERNANGTAHPEVKECCEAIATLLEKAHSQFNRELFEKILN